MKRAIQIAAVALMSAACVFAGDTGGKDYLVVAWPQSYTNGTFYSTTASTNNAFDLTAYNGFGKLIFFVSADEGTVANTNTSDTVFIQHAETKTGVWSTVSAVVGPALNTTSKVHTVSVDLETLKNWFRIGVTQHTLGETNCAHTVGAVLVCPQKND